MKSAMTVCVFLMAALALVESNKYTDRYDSVNLDEILSNRRLLLPYIKCILDQGTCAPDAKELKAHILEALETDCSKCTESQKKGTTRVIGHLINNEQDYWNKLCAKYDPDNKFRTKYESRLQGVQV